MFQKILTCYDFSPSSRKSLEWALKMTRESGARLTVMHVIDYPYYFGKASDTPPSMIETIREEIEKDVRNISKQKVSKEIRIEVAPGKTVSLILKAIDEEVPDLVVIGTHGKTGWAPVRLGSIAEKIVRHSSSPVFVARENPAWPVQNILLPIDIAEPSEEALLLATFLNPTSELQIHLLHVLSLLDYTNLSHDSLIPAESIDIPILEKYSLEHLNKISSAHPHLRILPHVSIGSIAREICQRAIELHSDLIIIPTHSRGVVARFFMGSVAETVVRYAPCSVLSFCPKK